MFLATALGTGALPSLALTEPVIASAMTTATTVTQALELTTTPSKGMSAPITNETKLASAACQGLVSPSGPVRVRPRRARSARPSR